MEERCQHGLHFEVDIPVSYFILYLRNNCWQGISRIIYPFFAILASSSLLNAFANWLKCRHLSTQTRNSAALVAHRGLSQIPSDEVYYSPDKKWDVPVSPSDCLHRKWPTLFHFKPMRPLGLKKENFSIWAQESTLQKSNIETKF